MTSSNNPPSDEDRKDAHLRICLEEPIERLEVTTGFERYRFEHDAFPEINRSNVDVSTTLFGKTLRAPLIIGAMTGGTTKAGQINQILAQAAQQCGVGMALGSQRKMIDDPTTASTFEVRDVAPDILLLGNVGAVQLNYGVSANDINTLIRKTGADVFAFHVNALQEAIQPEGDTNFEGLVSRLADVIPKLSVPVVFKEVGAGFGEKAIRKIAHLPFEGLETAGVGGTSWSKIESFRGDNWVQQMTGQSLATWGIPTSESLRTAVRLLGGTKVIICSGGLRTGIQMAKAICMGADLVATALPFLRAATEGGVDGTVLAIQQYIDELKTILFVTGCRNLTEFRQQKLIHLGTQGS